MPEANAEEHSLSDEQLMRLIQSGRHEALEQLYLRYGGLVRSVISRGAPGINKADIDELCQEVFLAVQKGATRYNERNRFKNWLYGIALKKSRQWYRNKWVRFNLRGRFATEYTAVAPPVKTGHDERYEMRQAIDGALAQLTPTLREPFIMSAADGFSAGEIAEILGINQRTVSSRIFRARQKLAALLDGQLGPLSPEVTDG